MLNDIATDAGGRFQWAAVLSSSRVSRLSRPVLGCAEHPGAPWHASVRPVWPSSQELSALSHMHRRARAHLCISYGTKVSRYNLLAQCRFLGLAISSAKILIYLSNKIYGSNFIKQNSETVMVWNYQNADCSLRQKIYCVIYWLKVREVLTKLTCRLLVHMPISYSSRAERIARMLPVHLHGPL